MFNLQSTISKDSPVNTEDSSKIKLSLTSLGYYDDTQTGLSPYSDDAFYQSIDSFQKKHTLKRDGVIKPDGPTHQKIKSELIKSTQAGNAFLDFKNNFDRMNEANTACADKYFHCVANYQATQRGWDGELIAHGLSDIKEFKDKYIKNYPDGEEDQKANKHGRQAAKSRQYNSAREACAIFRPDALDEKY